jgi:hypothetical protein
MPPPMIFCLPTPHHVANDHVVYRDSAQRQAVTVTSKRAESRGCRLIAKLFTSSVEAISPCRRET